MNDMSDNLPNVDTGTPVTHAAPVTEVQLKHHPAKWSHLPEPVHAEAGHIDHTISASIASSAVDDTAGLIKHEELTAEAHRAYPVVTRSSVPSHDDVIGPCRGRQDLRDMVNGKALFGLDVRLPGMKVAAVKHAPVLGTRVASLGTPPAGTEVVNLETAVAVVAADTWSARKALNDLSVSWTDMSYAERAFVDSSIQNSCLTSLLSSPIAAVAEAVPEKTRASSILRLISSQPVKLNATYSAPLLAHACMEALNCTVEIIRADGTEIIEAARVWCPTRTPDRVAKTVHRLIPSLDASRITVNTTLMGGGYDRKAEQDFVEQAVRVALCVKGPVKLMWWRDEDFARDRFRPAAMSKIQAGLDKHGKIQGWYNRIAAPSVLRANGLLDARAAYSSFADPEIVSSATGSGEEPIPYRDAMECRVVDYVEQKTGFTLSHWQSAGQSIGCFAIESAIDECARLLGEDPCAYRASLLHSNPRMKALLDDVMALSKWKEPAPPDVARGLALSPGVGSQAALVAELSKVAIGKASVIKVSRIFCSIDCGIALNSDEVVAQVEGGIVQGLSTARWGKVTFDKGVCQVRNFGHYRLSRMADTPEIIVRIVEQVSTPGASGEIGAPPVAPALANAYAALTGIRKRSLPLEF